MIDFIKDICTPAKVYFVISLLIGIYTLFTGKLLNHITKDVKKSDKSKKMLKELNRLLYFGFIFSLIVLVLITLLFNYFCTLGYVNIVGGVVFVLILYRIYNLFYKNY